MFDIASGDVLYFEETARISDGASTVDMHLPFEFRFLSSSFHPQDQKQKSQDESFYVGDPSCIYDPSLQCDLYADAFLEGGGILKAGSDAAHRAAPVCNDGSIHDHAAAVR
jgi:hypothetical protein